jgi:hypothetical protein
MPTTRTKTYNDPFAFDGKVPKRPRSSHEPHHITDGIEMGLLGCRRSVKDKTPKIHRDGHQHLMPILMVITAHITSALANDMTPSIPLYCTHRPVPGLEQ